MSIYLTNIVFILTNERATDKNNKTSWKGDEFEEL